MKTICGDTADNLKGVAGIGEKKAAALLENFPKVRNVKQLVASVREADHSKGPEKLVMEQRKSLLAQSRATSMKRAVKEMEQAGVSFRIRRGALKKKAFEKKCQKYQMFSLIKRMDDILKAFGSAFTQGRSHGVFDALEELT